MKNCDIDFTKLSKEISYILRHAPWEYELELNSEGWVGIEQLLSAVRSNKHWKTITENDLRKMIELSNKKRHEIFEGKIRALYGHSVPQKILKADSVPPSILYHGTAMHLVEQILVEGLKPMGRQYVHLSVDIETAQIVGRRKDSNPTLIKVYAKKAANEGIKFYQGNDIVWLSDYIFPEYLSVDYKNETY